MNNLERTTTRVSVTALHVGIVLWSTYTLHQSPSEVVQPTIQGVLVPSEAIEPPKPRPKPPPPKPPETEPRTVTIAVTADGVLHWNQDTIDEASLEARLQQAASEQPQPEIHVRGDRSVEYERVMKVMAAAQRAGMEKLGFVTAPDQ